ncbi:MAG TPA: mechanosensitive ion channel family protein [Lichenihabitans sp.]|nr:mechanosensitive ion channel family protein [Lichenihabitans sp.]
MTLSSFFPWLTFAVAAVLTAWTRKSRPWSHLALSFVSLAVFGWILHSLTGSLVKPSFPDETSAFGALLRRVLVAAWWLLLARTLIVAGQLAFGLDRQHHPIRIASDLGAGVIYLAAIIAILDLAFGVSVTGLVATSGIIAIVLGLALQSTLGDLFSGLAIGIDRPFKVGDLIWIEGSVEGRVIEINWRSTRVATATADVATVPNSVVAKSRLLNRSSPSENHTDTVRIVLDPEVPPLRAIEVLRAATLNASLLASHPEPAITCTELRGEGSFYEITFTAPLTKIASARTDVLRQVARHTRYAGIALAPQNGTALKLRTEPTLVECLKANLLLQTLSDEEVTALAVDVITHRGQAGESIFRQGSHLASMFLIHQGAFEVCRDDGVGPRRVGTIGSGDYFGELALLTGVENAATVRALTAFVAYEVTKAAIEPLLQSNPSLLHAFEEGVAKAQALLDRTIAAQASSIPMQQGRLLDRIKVFFGVMT